MKHCASLANQFNKLLLGLLVVEALALGLCACVYLATLVRRVNRWVNSSPRITH